MIPVIIFDQAGAFLTTIGSYNEITAAVRVASDADTKEKFFLVELTRRMWSQCDPEDFCGHLHRAGVYRTKVAATDELLRLWHLQDAPHDVNDKYLTFQFRQCAKPIHPLELTNLATAFI